MVRLKIGRTLLAIVVLTVLYLMAAGTAWAGPAFIDAHCHLFGHMPGGGHIQDFPGAAAAAVATMDKHNIRLSIIMPPPFNDQQAHRYDFEEFKPAIDQYPGRFAFLGGGGTLSPMIIGSAGRSGEVSAELKAAFAARARQIISQGAVGFGEMTALHLSMTHNHPFEVAPPDHPLFLLLADIAAELDVPVDLHMEAVPRDMAIPEAHRRSPNPDRLEANIAALERLLAHNRKARIIWAHVGWDNTGQRTAALTRRLLESHPNLYMSFKLGRRGMAATRPVIRGQGIRPEWLRLLRDYPERFILGSDTFHMAPGATGRMPNRIKPITRLAAKMPRGLLQAIGRDNPRTIFRLNTGR